MLIFTLWDPPDTSNSLMASCRTTAQRGTRTVHLLDWWTSSVAAVFPLWGSLFIYMLHSLLLQRGHTFADLLPAFDWGWGRCTLFYYLVHAHTGCFNCCIHPLLLQINALPLSELEELSEGIDLFIFLFLLIMSSTAPPSFLWHRVHSCGAIFHVQCSDICHWPAPK